MEKESPIASTSSMSSSRQTSSSAPVYSGIPDRQTVQVIQQALTRQPSTAAQYLQQMYAAQQQHLMLQTAALQQQHLSSAQLQSLASAQQASLAASRASPAVTASQPPAAAHTQVSLSSAPQIIQHSQGVSAAPAASGITQQTVLLGNPASPALSASQAQMYLRAQMLIFTPAVSSIQSDAGSAAPTINTQVQDLALRGPSHTPLPSLAMKPTISMNPATKPGDNPEQQRKSDTSRTVVPVSAHSIITPAFSSPLVQQKQIHGPFSIQPGPVLPLSQISSPRPAPPSALTTPAVTSRAHPVLQLPQQCASLLPTTSAVILQIPSAPGMDGAHKPCAPQKRHPSISPSLLHIQPSPVAQAAVSITQKPLPQDSGQTCQPEPDSCPPLDMTSGNGSSPLPAAATGSSAQNGENKPPQAVVKPQILTHVIEGFVIQEGAQPFPSHRSRAVHEVECPSIESPQPHVEKPPQQDTNTTTDSEMETFLPESKNEGDPPKLKCELCGRVDFEYKFKRSKRFCSMACAKRYNVGCTKRVGLFHPDRSKLQKPGGAKHGRRRSRKGAVQNHGLDLGKQVSGPVTALNPLPTPAKHPNSQEDSSRCSDNSSMEEPLSPISGSSSMSQHRHPERTLPQHLTQNLRPSDPTQWNVEEVYGFIRSLPGCQEISEEFRAQEIDGQALLLLKEDHLMSTMNIKLGPALKIYARISKLKGP